MDDVTFFGEDGRKAPTTALERLSCALGVADILIYPPRDLQRKINESKTPFGGCLTLLLPVALAIAFGISYANNENMPTVSQATARDIGDAAPFFVAAQCKTSDGHGNANPFCPMSGGIIPPPLGWQYVPNLAGTRCAQSVATMSAANFSRAFPWMNDLTSPAVAAAEVAAGVSPEDIASTNDEFQLTTYDGLASDLFVDQNVWMLAGSPLATLGTTPPGPFTVNPTSDINKFARASTYQTDASLRAEFPQRIRTDLLDPPVFPNDGANQAAKTAAAAPGPQTITTAPIPLCPFPDVAYSASLKATPSTSGLGYLITLPPYFNWTAFSTNASSREGDEFALRHTILPTDDGLITEPVPLEVVKGITTLGGSPLSSELEIWRWYARSMGWDTASDLLFPYVSYDIDVTRTTYFNGTKPKVRAVATVTAGKMSHADVANYYGYGSGSVIAPLAACGDVYVTSRDDIELLYNVAVQTGGYEGTLEDFIDEDSIELADLLPSTNMDFVGGCETPEARVQGWPVPQCTAAQSARSAASGIPASLVDMPLTFNVSDSTLQTQLRDAYSRIRNLTQQFVHGNLLSSVVSSKVVRNASYGWLDARMHAHSLAAMMELQHGCGLYCAKPRRKGVGSASSVWFQPTATQSYQSRRGALASGDYLVSYVQRQRPQLICGNASSTLGWSRDDPTEFYSGDLSRIITSPSAAGWTSYRLAVPAAVVLFRTRSWTDVAVSSTQQSLSTIIGSTLGYSGLIIFGLLNLKRVTYLVIHACCDRGGPKRTASEASLTSKASQRNISTDGTDTPVVIANIINPVANRAAGGVGALLPAPPPTAATPKAV